MSSSTARTALSLFTIVGVGCSGPAEDSVADDPPSQERQAQEPVALECEEKGFPCTWAEVPAEVNQRSQAVVGEALESLQRGDSLTAVAFAIHAMPDVAEVMVGESALRVRVDGGRPEWIYLSTELLTIGSLPRIPLMASTSTAAPDPVGQDDIAKDALILSAYDWQWDLEGSTDKVDSVAALFEKTRDYEKGSVEIRRNKLNRATVPPRIDYGVTVEDFNGWDAYDAVHVSTHGSTVCRVVDSPVPGGVPELLWAPCETSLSTAELWLGSEPAGGAGKAYTTVEGIGRGWVPVLANHAHDVSSAAGVELPPPSFPLAGYWGVGPLVSVTTEFFIKAYPQGLDETLVVLNACQSGKENRLIRHLSGSNSTVMGWTRTMGLGEATAAGLCFWQTMLGLLHDRPFDTDICQTTIYQLFEDSDDRPFEGGATVEDAVMVLMQGGFDATSAATIAQGGETVLSSGDANLQVTPESSVFEPVGTQRNRAIEIVRLVETDTRIELIDSGFVSVGGTPGDGQPDTLLAELEVFGIGPSDDPDEMTLYLDVDGVRQSQSYALVSRPSNDRARTTAQLPLDVDLAPDGTIDVEVWLEYADGTSHWEYVDLSYTNLWTANVGVGPYAGGYRGSDGAAQLRPDGGLHTIVLRAPESASPYVHIIVQRIPGEPPTDVGSYPLGQFDDVAVAFARTSFFADPEAMKYAVANDGGSATVFIDEWTEDRMRGRIEGTFIHNAYPVTPGYDHPARAEDDSGPVSVRFSVPACVLDRNHPRACAR